MERELTRTEDTDRDREAWMARIASQLARLLVEATARPEDESPPKKPDREAV
ncbi:MAG: hypothetical protein U9R79_11765 [Armatimonadota bacterium]|nr:hypothetical protein [Armatimonadota bacterium]